MILLQEDHHAIGKLDALRLLRLERGKLRDGNLLPVRDLRQSRAAPGALSPSPARVEEGFSLRTSLVGGARRLLALLGSSSGTGVLDDADGAIGVVEDLVGDASNIGLSDLVNAVDGPE